MDFQVVCEVSANKGLTDSEYRQQLDSALRHAVDEHNEAGVSVTYVLLLNLREASTDKRIHKIYREFVKANKKANEKTLGLWGPIRFVLMGAVEFSTLLKQLDYEDVLTCRSDLLAAALDHIHDALWRKKVPTGDDWMADQMYSLIYEGSQTAAALFPAPRAVE